MLSVLIVDDDAQIRQLLKDYLAGFGMSVTGVTDGTAMAEALNKNTFDLVILDLMLPERTAFQFAAACVQNPISPSSC